MSLFTRDSVQEFARGRTGISSQLGLLFCMTNTQLCSFLAAIAPRGSVWHQEAPKGGGGGRQITRLQIRQQKIGHSQRFLNEDCVSSQTFVPTNIILADKWNSEDRRKASSVYIISAGEGCTDSRKGGTTRESLATTLWWLPRARWKFTFKPCLSLKAQ